MRDVLGRSFAIRLAHGHRFPGGAVALVAAAALAFGSPSASAQQAQAPAAAAPTTVAAVDQSLEEIVVTARKRSESLQDIPSSVQAIPESVIRENHMTQLDDIGSLVSNINIFDAHDNSPAVTMRGVGAFELVQGVGFYLNDVQLYEGQTVRPSDISRIEVLKGPQGTLYGGANIGGAIKYITKDPGPTWANEATLEVGNYKTGNVEAIVSGPVADKLGMRLSVYDDNQGGYITDTYHNEVIGAKHDKGGRLVLLAEPESATTVRLTLNADDFNSQNENLQYRVTEINPLAATVPQPYTADQYRYSVDDYFIPDFVRKLFATAVQVDHQFDSGVNLTSITSQFWSLNRGVTDFTKKPLPIDQLFQYQDQRVVSQELRLASTAHSNLDWLVGVFAQQHKTDTQNSDLNWNADPLNPQLVPFIAGVQAPFDYDLQNKVQKNFAIFGDMTYYVADWQYELGLRAEHYSSDMHARNDNGLGGGPLVLGPTTYTGTEVSPRMSISYKFSPMTNVYGTYARGFQPGDLTEQNGEIDKLRPEVANSFELGVKSRFAGGAQITGAVYFVNYQDRWYQTFKDIPGGFQDVTNNIGGSKNSGIEMNFVLPIAKEYRLSGGFGTTRAKWGNVRYGDPQLTGIYGGGVTPYYSNLNGLTAPFTPAYTADLAFEWNHTLANGAKVGAKVDGTAIGQSYWDPNDYARQPAYQLLNVGAHLDTAAWSFIARCTNLGGTNYNTIYWDNWDVGGIPHSFAHIGRPRLFSLSSTYRF